MIELENDGVIRMQPQFLFINHNGVHVAAGLIFIIMPNK